MAAIANHNNVIGCNLGMESYFRLTADITDTAPTDFRMVGIGTHIIYKVLWSATANAENNNGADVDELKVATIMVDEGPILKRFMARAKGRGTRISKRTSHITVVVGSGKKG
mgnify:CR=1 FL=1